MGSDTGSFSLAKLSQLRYVRTISVHWTTLQCLLLRGIGTNRRSAAAQVVVFKEADVQTDGASYESSEWRTVPEENKEYSDVASNLVLNPRTGMIMDSDGGAENGTINKPGGGVVVVRTLPDTDQPELSVHVLRMVQTP